MLRFRDEATEQVIFERRILKKFFFSNNVELAREGESIRLGLGRW